jgi:hypothetical protein
VVTTDKVGRLMKRCQYGVGGRNALDDAHSILAECYGTLGALVQQRDELLRGEYICKRCGLRKNSCHQSTHDF